MHLFARAGRAAALRTARTPARALSAEPPMALEDERQLRTGALCAGDATIANWLHTIGRLCRSRPWGATSCAAGSGGP